MRGRGTKNWKLIRNSGNYFLTTLGQHGLSASPYLSTLCFSPCMLSFTTVHGRTSPLTLKFIHALMVLWSHLNSWEKIQFEASVCVWSSQLWWMKPKFHFRPHFYGRGVRTGHTTLRGRGKYTKRIS